MSLGLSERRGWSLSLGLLLAAAALAATGLVQAEVVDTQPSGPSENGHTIHQEPVALECWQNGRRIIQREGLRGLTVKSVTSKGAVAFKPVDSEQPEVFLLPFDDSLCLVGPED